MMDTTRIIKALFNISNAPRYKNAFQNSVYVRNGYAYAANQIAVVECKFPFVSERGFDTWETIIYNDDNRHYELVECSEPYSHFHEMVNLTNASLLGFCKVDAVELARILRLFSACDEPPTITVSQSHEMLLEAYNGRKDLTITAKIMGMR